MRRKRGNRLRLIEESEAPPRTREIFADIRQSLGLHAVPALYQAYAVFPRFLEVHWEAFRPVVESHQFFLLGARLAAESYTRAHNYLEVPDLAEREVPPTMAGALPLSQVLDYYQYLDPLLLLLAAAQLQAFEGPLGQPHQVADPAHHPSFPVAPHMLKEGEATPAVQHMWREWRRVLEPAFISEEHRALACWPEFYQRYWWALKEQLQSPLYADCQGRISDSALNLVRELPVCVGTSIPRLLEAGLDGEQLPSLARMSEALVPALARLLLDVTFARIGCEGGTRGESTRFQRQPGVAQQPDSPTRAA